MSTISSRGRVVAAVATALLAGSLTAWFTHPEALATPGDTPHSRGTKVLNPPPPDDPVSSTSRIGSSGPSVGQATTAPTSVTPLLGRPAQTAPPRTSGPAPTSFSIKRLGITMTVIPEGVAKDGEMALAPDPADIGWYRFGTRPGDPTGATVLAAHLDAPGYGVGPLVELITLRAGDLVTVTSGSTIRSYTVETVTAIKKTALDLDALFTRNGPPRLHIVTCGGNFDRKARHYDENVVVVARPTP